MFFPRVSGLNPLNFMKTTKFFDTACYIKLYKSYRVNNPIKKKYTLHLTYYVIFITLKKCMFLYYFSRCYPVYEV